MPGPTKIQEKAIRTALAAGVQSILTTSNVFDRRRYITSKKDFARALGKLQVDDKTEIVFTEIEFLRFVDDPERGWDDCPSVSLFYSIHHFRQFRDERVAVVDDVEVVTNSNDEFVGEVLDLRDYFLATRQFAEGQSEPLTMPENAQFGKDELIDFTGHAADLEVEIVWNLTD